MGVEGSAVRETNSTRRNTRVSRKKRRTEISSSEESSSSSEDDNEETVNTAEAATVEQSEPQDDHMEDVEDIEGLEVPANGGNSITESLGSKRDVMETRLKLGEVQTHFSNTGNGLVSSEEWVSAMVGQYGEDINQLRQSADFKTGSIAQVARLLRESNHVVSK